MELRPKQFSIATEAFHLPILAIRFRFTSSVRSKVTDLLFESSRNRQVEMEGAELTSDDASGATPRIARSKRHYTPVDERNYRAGQSRFLQQLERLS